MKMSSSAEHDHLMLNDDIYDMSFIDYIHRVILIFQNCNGKKNFSHENKKHSLTLLLYHVRRKITISKSCVRLNFVTYL